MGQELASDPFSMSLVRIHSHGKRPLELSNDRSAEKVWVVASDVGDRDGIGVELLLEGALAMEIFRDDTKRTREITLYRTEMPLELVEEIIAKFKSEIPWDFLD